MTLPGSDAAIVRVKETRRAIGMTLDSNNRYCRLDPRAGARLIIAEAARNLVCTGAKPLAITNCLNFASPEHPEVMWSFSEVVDGIAETCLALGTPVTGGNVSFYNETDGQGIDPTPVIGMVGLIEDPMYITSHHFSEEGDVIILLGETANDLGGSEFLTHIYSLLVGPVPFLDLDRERAVQTVCLEAIRLGLIKSAHDCSDGGLVIALAESCFSGDEHKHVGVQIDAAFFVPDIPDEIVPLIFLFSESPSRIVVSVSEERVEELERLAQLYRVSYTILGTVRKNQFTIKLNKALLIDEPVARLDKIWRNYLTSMLS